MTFLCGTMFSLNALPDVAKWVIEILPLTHTSECIRAAALDWSFPWISLAVLLVYGAAFYLLSLYALRQSN